MIGGNCFLKTSLFFLPFLFIFASCLTIHEDKYMNLTYEDLVKKRGTPSYTISEIIEKNRVNYDFEPNFSEHFSSAELEASVEVKYASWKRTHSALMVWFKCIDETWVSFSSTEYRGPFLK